MEPDYLKYLSGAGAGGSSIGLLWFIFRQFQRTDRKETIVDRSWEHIVTGLREEIGRLRQEQIRMEDYTVREQKVLLNQLGALEEKVATCEEERAELLARVKAFERRYGTRRDDEQRLPNWERVE